MGQPSRPAMVTPWGKCLASVKTTIPEETEPALARGKRRSAPGIARNQGMTTPGQFHRPKPAEVVNAFGRIHQNTPSVFCTAKDIGEQARKAGQMSAKGRANVQASNDRLNKIIKPARATKQQIVYSKARAR